MKHQMKRELAFWLNLGQRISFRRWCSQVKKLLTSATPDLQRPIFRKYIDFFRSCNVSKTRNKRVGKRKTELKTTSTKKKKKKKQHMYDPYSARLSGIRGNRKQYPEDPDWAAGLPDDLLKLVIKKLPFVDFLSFSNVCKPWRSVTTNLFDGSSRVIPLLVKPGPIEKTSMSCVNVLDNTKNSRFDIPMPKKYIGSYIWGSYRDWLCLLRPFKKRSRQIFLLNPFSGEKVVLPVLNELDFTYYCKNIVLSSVPSDPKCIVMLVGGRFWEIAFWTSGAPHEWCMYKLPVGTSIVDATYHEGHFYLLSRSYDEHGPRSYKMIIIDKQSVLDKMLLNRFYVITSCVFGLEDPCLDKHTQYIVGSREGILLVCRRLDSNPRDTFGVWDTFGIETFRLDVSRRAWVKWESSLENNNEMIILGRSCSRPVDAKEELGDHTLANKILFSNTTGLRLNKWGPVHGTFVDWDNDDEWSVISLGDFDRLGKFYPDIWVTAPIWWCLRQQTLKHHR